MCIYILYICLYFIHIYIVEIIGTCFFLKNIIATFLYRFYNSHIDVCAVFQILLLFIVGEEHIHWIYLYFYEMISSEDICRTAIM